MSKRLEFHKGELKFALSIWFYQRHSLLFGYSWLLFHLMPVYQRSSPLCSSWPDLSKTDWNWSVLLLPEGGRESGKRQRKELPGGGGHARREVVAVSRRPRTVSPWRLKVHCTTYISSTGTPQRTHCASVSAVNVSTSHTLLLFILWTAVVRAQAFAWI
jgi:hypothetical protein